LLDGEAPTLAADWKLVTQGLTIDDVLIAGLAAQGKAKREGQGLAQSGRAGGLTHCHR
jgi:hypothetical protein